MSEEVRTRGIKNSNEDASFIGYPPRYPTGRRQIFTNVPEITRNNVIQELNKALRQFTFNRDDEKYLERYARGIQPILGRVKDVNSNITNRIVVNLASQILTFKVTSLAGEPVVYVSRGNNPDVPEKVEKLNAMMFSEGKASKDIMLAKNMFTCGVGYRLLLNDKAKYFVQGDLLDEAPFEIYIPEPTSTFVVRLNDVTRRVVMGVTFVFTDDTRNAVEFTVYTPNETFYIAGGLQEADHVIWSELHNFGMVTLFEYPCNPMYMGAFENVLSLLDAYNNLMSNRIDGIEQFIQALMVFEGVDITREQFLALKNLGAIVIPPTMDGRTSRVYYLNEQLDQSQSQTLADNIYERILQISGMPSQGNANTSDSSNNGAMIIKSGQWDAQAKNLETQGMWKESDNEFVKAVLKICDDTGVIKGLKASDLEPKFGIHTYEDRLVKTQSFTTLIAAGCPPLQAFTLSGVSKDPEADAIAYEAYQTKLEQELNDATITQRSVSYDTDMERAQYK